MTHKNQIKSNQIQAAQCVRRKTDRDMHTARPLHRPALQCMAQVDHGYLLATLPVAWMEDVT